MSTVRSKTFIEERLTVIQETANALTQVGTQLDSHGQDAEKTSRAINTLRKKVEQAIELGREAFRFANKDNGIELSIKKEFYAQFVKLNECIITFSRYVTEKCLTHCNAGDMHEFRVEFEYYRLFAKLHNLPFYPHSGTEIESISKTIDQDKNEWQKLFKASFAIRNENIKNLIDKFNANLSEFNHRWTCTAAYNFSISCLNTDVETVNSKLNNYKLAWKYFKISEQEAEFIKPDKKVNRIKQISEARKTLVNNILDCQPSSEILQDLATYFNDQQTNLMKMWDDLKLKSNNLADFKDLREKMIAHEIILKLIIGKMIPVKSTTEYNFANNVLVGMEIIRSGYLCESNSNANEEIKDLMLLISGHKTTTTKVAKRLNINPQQIMNNNVSDNKTDDKKDEIASGKKQKVAHVNTSQVSISDNNYRPLRSPPF